MSVIASLHQDLVFNRRVRVLSQALAELLPRGATVLDVGCGNGLIALLISELRPDVTISGLDILVRPETHIPVEAFDGSRIPRADNSVDIVMFVDVLHHTEDPDAMLREAKRVARQGLVLKDHTRDGFLAKSTLRFMDWVGNAHHGVVLPYNHWPERRWRESIDQLGLITIHWQSRLGLYPWPASWLFDRSLHFIARLDQP